VSSYTDSTFLAGADASALTPRLSRRQQQRALEQLVPDARARAALEAMFAAQPDAANRFPGGIVQFVQFVAQMDGDALEGLMLEAAHAAGAEGGGGDGEGRMPGQMPGQNVWDIDFGAVAPEGEGAEDEDDWDDDEEGEDTEGAAPAMPVRLLRNVINRFWGGTGEGNASDDEDEEDEDAHAEEENRAD
jgi:hypothetical protein